MRYDGTFYSLHGLNAGPAAATLGHRRVLNVGAVIADAQTEPFTGPVPYLVERFTELALQGIDAFILWPSQDPANQIERFAAEVIPAVREAVAKT